MTASQELLHAVILRLDYLVLSASDLLVANELVVSDTTDTLEVLPSLFGLLWKHRHIVFHTTQSDANDESNERSSISEDIQFLLGHYCRLHRHTLP